jgi:DNA-binding transcriptional LysR family regulator
VPLSNFNPINYIQSLSGTYPELKFSLSSGVPTRSSPSLATINWTWACAPRPRQPQLFRFFEIGETRVGLLYDNRHFHFEGSDISWEDAAELPLGMITTGMHYRKSIDLSFRSRGLNPQPILESDSTYQLLQAIHQGFCCSIMPLDSGWKSRSNICRSCNCRMPVCWHRWGW